MYNGSGTAIGWGTRLRKFLAFLLFVVGAIYAVFAVMLAVESLEHYARVYQNPLTVTARVTAHVKDGDEYQSLLSYTADGTTYSDIEFEEKEEILDLTPVGTIVTIQVSPEDPAQTIADLLSFCGSGIMISAVVCCLLAGTVWKWVLRRFLSKEKNVIPETEILERDLRLTILSRKAPIAWMVLGGLQIAVWVYYLGVFSADKLIFPAICIVIGVLCLVSVFRKLRLVNEPRYRLEKHMLIRKEQAYGNKYRLVFKGNNGQEWSKIVKEKEYLSVRTGSTILTVHLPGKAEPVLRYTLMRGEDDLL